MKKYSSRCNSDQNPENVKDCLHRGFIAMHVNEVSMLTIVIFEIMCDLTSLGLIDSIGTKKIKHEICVH